MCVYTYTIHTHIYIYTCAHIHNTHIYLKSPWLFSKCPTPLSKFYPHPWENHHVGCQFKTGFHENPKANSTPVTSLMLGKAPRPKAAHRRKGLQFSDGCPYWLGGRGSRSRKLADYISVGAQEAVGAEWTGAALPPRPCSSSSKTASPNSQTGPPCYHPVWDGEKAKKQRGIIPRY